MEKMDGKPHINVDYFEDLTGDIQQPGKKAVEPIGARIRSLRESRGLSLEDLSHMTGFEVDLLAGIENEEIQPQLGTVIKLSKALDSALGRLISSIGSGLYSVTRKDERRQVARSTSSKGKQEVYSYQSLAPEVKGRHMEALMVTLKENIQKEMSVHDGEEFIYVVEGTIQVLIGEETFALDPGDSVYYLSTTPHMLSALNGTARILAVVYGG